MFSGFVHLSEANGEATTTSESELTSFHLYIPPIRESKDQVYQHAAKARSSEPHRNT